MTIQFVQVTEDLIINLDHVVVIRRSHDDPTVLWIETTGDRPIFLDGKEGQNFWKAITHPEPFISKTVANEIKNSAWKGGD